MTYDPNQQPGQQQQQPYGQPGQQQPYGQEQYGQQYPQQQQYGAAQPGYAVPATTQLASWGTRFVAYIIDFIILLVPLCILSMLFGETSTSNGGFSASLTGLPSLLGYIIQAAYFGYFWTTTGQTIGHKAMGLRVVRENGEPITWGTALIRYVGYIVNSIPLLLGWLWPLFDSKNQGFHDKMAGTLVVRA